MWWKIVGKGGEAKSIVYDPLPGPPPEREREWNPFPTSLPKREREWTCSPALSLGQGGSELWRVCMWRRERL
jgi:hypothetical protein